MIFFLKNSLFSGRIWLDRGNTERAGMVGLVSIGLRTDNVAYDYRFSPSCSVAKVPCCM